MTHACLTLAIVSAGLMVSCAAATADGRSRDPLLGTWVLTMIDGEVAPGSSDDDEAKPLTFKVDDEGKVGGYAGVNQYFSTLDREKLAEGVFELGTIGSTLMAGPPQRMQLERRFLKHLAQARRAAVDRDTLTLFKDDDALLTFKRDAP